MVFDTPKSNHVSKTLAFDVFSIQLSLERKVTNVLVRFYLIT